MQASEAQRLTDIANRPDHEKLDELIRQAACKGETQVDVDMIGVTSGLVRQTISELTANGFTVYRRRREEDPRIAGSIEYLNIRW